MTSPVATYSPQVATLVRCAEHLETAKFVEFWEVANLGGNELLDEVPGFDEAIRSYMVGVLSITFQKIEVRLHKFWWCGGRVGKRGQGEAGWVPKTQNALWLFARVFLLLSRMLTQLNRQRETIADLLALDEGDLEEYVSANQSEKLAVEDKHVSNRHLPVMHTSYTSRPTSPLDQLWLGGFHPEQREPAAAKKIQREHQL